MTTVPCPHCGAEIAEDATFCRSCGSSDADGWSGDGDAELDEEFDYDEFVERHFADGRTNTKLAPIWRAVAVVLLISFLAWALLAF